MQTAIWNSADKDANIILSGGDLTATTNADGWDSVRSNLSVSAGKWYFEITVDLATNGYIQIGIADSGVSLSGEPGTDADGYAYRGLSGDKMNNNVWTAYGDTFITGDIISVAIDMDTGKLWWGKNGTWQASGDPAAGTNEAYDGIAGDFYAILCLYGNTWAATANFGASAFTYSVPSGFNEGFGIVYEIEVTNPAMTAEGFTGMQSDITLPMATAEGFTGIYSAPSIPMQIGAGTLSDNMVHIQSDVTIPSMTAAITQAKQIWGAVINPMMTAELTERETVLGNVTIPMMTAELRSGLHADIDVSAPMMTAAGLFSGRCAVTVPMMEAALTGKVGRVGNISVKLPMMTVSMAGKVEHLGNISVSVPMMLALAELITGKIITGAATIPMMTAALSSYEDLTGDIDVSIPMMVDYLSGTTARFTSCAVVLRYVEPV